MRINELYDSLRAVYYDWSNYLVNPRYVRQSNIIAWDDYMPEKTWIPSIVRVLDVARLVDDGQYTFQIAEDGSLIQLYYAYDARGRSVVKANLAYYQSNVENRLDLSSMQDIDLLLEAERSGDSSFFEEFVQEMSNYGKPLDAPVSWLRIDFAPEDGRGVLHHDCHMHISGFSGARLVVMGVPTPQQFVEFIMALCYPHIYGQHRELDATGAYPDEDNIIRINTPSIPVANSLLSRCITHLCIPSNQ